MERKGTSFSGITRGLESVNRLLEAVDLASHREELVHLKEALLAAQEEALALKEESLTLRTKLTAKEGQASLDNQMKFDGVFYWTGDHSDPSHGPFCPRCFDVDKRKVRLQNNWSDHFSCPGCNTSLAGPNGGVPSCVEFLQRNLWAGS